MKRGKEEGYDIVLCDTSGRKLSLYESRLFDCLFFFFFNVGFTRCTCRVFPGLHTNYSLMEELIACKKAVGKVVPGAPNVSLSTRLDDGNQLPYDLWKSSSLALFSFSPRYKPMHCICPYYHELKWLLCVTTLRTTIVNCISFSDMRYQI